MAVFLTVFLYQVCPVVEENPAESRGSGAAGWVSWKAYDAVRLAGEDQYWPVPPVAVAWGMLKIAQRFYLAG